MIAFVMREMRLEQTKPGFNILAHCGATLLHLFPLPLRTEAAAVPGEIRHQQQKRTGFLSATAHKLAHIL